MAKKNINQAAFAIRVSTQDPRQLKNKEEKKRKESMERNGMKSTVVVDP